MLMREWGAAVTSVSDLYYNWFTTTKLNQCYDKVIPELSRDDLDNNLFFINGWDDVLMQSLESLRGH